ncbi:hypothetical protein A3Q56_08790 [Intoshia linei]|uniref:Uncharacterized protein n=1 Tax=Intoshia linei TaxID=1819745 RepID=A0A177AQ19_9BILA|nr:hypothetical protein A3Q56_08790 [Intoshia linei]
MSLQLFGSFKNEPQSVQLKCSNCRPLSTRQRRKRSPSRVTEQHTV